MKKFLPFALILLAYLLVIVPFTAYLRARPVAVKVGYMPSADSLRLVAREHRYALAESAVIKILFYFGTIDGETLNLLGAKPDYRQMYENLVQAIKLDPYNSDAYYFAQATFTWEARRIKEVNGLLEYGMKYRTNDYQLPFWLGFNCAYFLHDYENAGRYFQRAAEISGQPLFSNLAARYFYEAGETDLGILYLDTLIKSAREPALKQLYTIRKEALEGVRTISQAVDAYRKSYNRAPADVQTLLKAGFLTQIPLDPYGGTFYIDANGRPKTTSNFATATPPEPSAPTGTKVNHEQSSDSHR